MHKELIYFLLSLILFTSCEEYYTPDIDIVEGELVVEALFTNDLNQNFVHLTRTTSFYSKQPAKAVPGAKVSLIEINGNVIKGIESIVGYFYFNSIPTSGRNYKLQILLNNDTYESEIVTMPPVPSITDFYTGTVTKKEYSTNGFGVPIALTVVERELYLDAAITAQLSNYRFSTRAILEWMYDPPALRPPPPPAHYGWQSYYANSLFNIAGPKQFSQAGKIEKHPVMFLPYDTRPLLKPDSTAVGWIVILDQYGTSRESYEYHEKLNSQFAATGSLFDPIQTQIYGNITCITDPSKNVFGYFDLNSYRQYRYFLYMSGPNQDNTNKPRQIFRYPYIPDNGDIIRYPPSWWE